MVDGVNMHKHILFKLKVLIIPFSAAHPPLLWIFQQARQKDTKKVQEEHDELPLLSVNCNVVIFMKI